MAFVYERNVPMTTRDGVILRANVWRPLEGTAPTLLLRHPYDKDGALTAGGPTSSIPSVLSFVNAGYAVVLQDARGAFQSDGVFEPKVNELADGEDVMAWLAEQEWCDGAVGAYGASYAGMTQWALALGRTPA